MSSVDRLTTKEHWDALHDQRVRLRLPSSLNVSTRDLQRILRRYVKPGMRVLEIGFAPGKILVWVHKVLGAEVTGLDYSEKGIATARALFDAVGARGELLREDVFSVSFPAASFDFSYSHGVIEHFDDPREIVRRHVLPLRPGGVALILIPNFRGLYGKLQSYFDLASLDIHNLRIMELGALRELAPADLSASARTFPFGRVDPWLLSLAARWPRPLARGVGMIFNAFGLLQPIDVAPLCPHLVLEITRGGSA